MVDKQKIGAFIASLRKEKNLTQAELAERLNVSDKSISRWENGQTLPDYDQVLDLCVIFGIGAADFLNGEFQQPNAQRRTETPADLQTPEQEETPYPQKHPVGRRGILLAAIGAALLLAVLILTLTLSPSCGTRVAIDANNFPDEAFLRFVEHEIPHKHSRYFTAEERLAVRELDCSRRKIERMDGLALFENLEVLDCGGNAIETLDLSGNRKLRVLNCGENALTALDVSALSALSELRCDENNLAALDVSKNAELTVLKCNDNAIAAIDVSKNPNLRELECYCNPAGSIVVTANPLLEKLDAWEVGFSTLDLSQNPELTYLNCDYGSLTELDLSHNPKIEVLYCAFNQLTELDIGNLDRLQLLSCGNNKLASLTVNAAAPLQVILCDTNRLTKLDLSAYTGLEWCICDDNPVSELLLPERMKVNAADADAFRIGDEVRIGPYPLVPDGEGRYRLDLGALVSKEHRDRVTVRTRGASQPDENGTVTLTAPVKELVYVFDTGFRHIGVEIHVALEPNE
jgi:Leucine-rich repeat (LRR) protein